MNKTSKFSLGGGALEPKSLVGQEIEADYTKKKKAFTLAEVLVTLAIIGVVAALTIPTVVAKYQQKMYYTQFMKVYNTLSNALAESVVENGNPDAWGIIDGHDKEIADKYLSPYLKVSKFCTTYSDCGITEDMDILYLNDPDAEYNDGYWEVFNENFFILSDGVILSYYYSKPDDELNLTFDTNGLKGPNTYGRDIFTLSFMEINASWKVIPQIMSINYDSEIGIRAYDEVMDDLLNSDSPDTNCTLDREAFGTECAARLLIEGKMNY